jgi:hypothetical protein
MRRSGENPLHGRDLAGHADATNRRPTGAGWAWFPALRPVPAHERPPKCHDTARRPCPSGAGGQGEELIKQDAPCRTEDRRPAHSPATATAGGPGAGLVAQPKALLLDEPFSALDRAVRHELYDELLELREALNIPVVLVTPRLPRGAAPGDSVIVLDRGECVLRGTPAEVSADQAQSRSPNARSAKHFLRHGSKA